MSPRGRLSRLPLRLRLVAGFSAASLVVLVAAGAFVYWRVQYALDRGLDTDLTRASATLEPLIGADGAVEDRAAADATGVAWQVVGADQAIADRGGPAGERLLLPATRLDSLAAGTSIVDVGGFLPASDSPYRLLVQRLDDGRVLIVGVRRDHRDEALRELLLQLGVAGAGTMVVTALVGDRLARAALRPVERYRRRAAEISDGGSGLRLEVPPERDDEITRLGHTFNDMLAALDVTMDRERRFVDEASHELRTPITLLGSRIQLALRRPRTVEEHERILAELRIDLDRLAELAEQLLHLGRTGAGDGVPATGDLAGAVERVVADRAVADPEHADDVRLVVPPGAVTVGLTDLEAERLTTNLLGNARTHGAVPVSVEVVVGDRWAVLQVADAGPGMAPELLATAHQRFVRADVARARPGAGLGLALVDALVAHAGGELRLCHAGHHVSHGPALPVACEHDDRMTVSVVLPLLSAGTAAPDD